MNPVSPLDGYFHCGADKYLPWEQVLAEHKRIGVGQGIAVQHLGAPSNDYLLTGARATAGAYKCVLMTDFGSPTLHEELKLFADDPDVIGVRLVADRHKDWKNEASLVLTQQLSPFFYFPDGLAATGSDVFAEFADLSKAHTRIVLTHTERARSRAQDFTMLKSLAAIDEVTLHISEPAERDGTRPELWRFIELVEIFGYGRVFWGSNYPRHDTIDTSWARQERGLAASATAAIAGDNARQWWW